MLRNKEKVLLLVVYLFSCSVLSASSRREKSGWSLEKSLKAFAFLALSSLSPAAAIKGTLDPRTPVMIKPPDVDVKLIPPAVTLDETWSEKIKSTAKVLKENIIRKKVTDVGLEALLK